MSSKKGKRFFNRLPSEGKIFVISSPSGGGKTTIRKHLLNSCSLSYSVSYTTRPPREGEKEGEDYLFISQEEFKRKREKGEFIEWTKVLKNYYATARDFLEKELQEGRNVLLEIDVRGAKRIKRMYKKQAVLIFIAPPSFEELERRLKKRKTEEEERRQRLFLAEKEMQEIDKYDYLVINKNLEECIEDIKAIIRAERCRI